MSGLQCVVWFGLACECGCCRLVAWWLDFDLLGVCELPCYGTVSYSRW